MILDIGDPCERRQARTQVERDPGKPKKPPA
jgi:hypothetical protein